MENHDNPILDVHEVRENAKIVMDTLEGVELEDLGDDATIHNALAIALIKHASNMLDESRSYKYLTTLIDFAKSVTFPGADDESLEIHPVNYPTEAITQYYQDLSLPVKNASQTIRAKSKTHQDAHVYLAIIYFSLMVLSTESNLATARKLVIDLLNEINTP